MTGKEKSHNTAIFEKYDKPTVFSVQGQEVIVAYERLADALCRLPEQRRVVLLMYFFQTRSGIPAAFTVYELLKEDR